MLGVFVKPLLASVGVEVIELSLIFTGSARLFGRSRSHRQAAHRVWGGFGHGRRLGTAAPALGCLVEVRRRILVKLLVAVIAAKIICFPFVVAGETCGLSLGFVHFVAAHRVFGPDGLGGRSLVSGRTAASLFGGAWFGGIALGVFFKVLFASRRAEIIGLVFMGGLEPGSFGLAFIH